MSLVAKEELNKIEFLDVDIKEVVKENLSIVDRNSDSGVYTKETCHIESVKIPTNTDTFSIEIGDQKDTKGFDWREEKTLVNITDLSFPSLTSDSPDICDGSKRVFVNHDPAKSLITSSNDRNIAKNNSNLHLNEESEQSFVTNIVASNDNTQKDCHDDAVLDNTLKTELVDKNIDVNKLTVSTFSLNDNYPIQNTNTFYKTTLSKSAENLTTLNHTENKTNIKQKPTDLNTEKILSEFKSHKAKVSAVQKIIPDNLMSNTDTKYIRLQKEILSQDLGSIVKNVHGIFSSVSGSLMNAYTHRANVQKPVKSTALVNGKVMSDIFEEENVEDKTKIIKANNIDKPIALPEKMLDASSNLVKISDELESVEQDSDPKTDVLRLQIDSLESLLSDVRKENVVLRDRLRQQVDELQGKDQVFKDLENKMDLMSKRVEQAEKDKDAAVMRYASVECTAIEARRAADNAAKAERAAIAEMELLNNKIKSAHVEKQRICQLYDDKCHELQNSEREIAKLREDMRELEGRLKWTQSKLRMEMDAYKDSAERIEKLTQQVSELEAAKEAAIANSADALKAKQLECELKESRAALILCRHEKEELDKRLTTATQQLDTCKKEMEQACSSLASTTVEVEQLKIKNARLEEEAAELAAMRAQAALADTLSAQLARETERAAQAEEALSVERARAETCARREAAALEHAARLTAQHVAQRATTTDHEAKAQALSLDNASLRERITELERESERLQTSLSEETERRNKETRVLARKVAELTEEVGELNKKLEWEKGENCVLKKKHASAIKEMNRELQRTLKRCEQLEAKLPPPEENSTRAGSVSSLSSGESAPQEERLQNGHTDSLPDIQVREPDKQALIERIVSLQRAAARRAERCDFLEEHSRQLTSELRAKSRLLRHLLSELPAGAVTSRHSDTNKKEIARLGGSAMAALWGGDSTGMTLELSLEINKRLQAVLEDTLLKNITLKENMDTLGEEISRLKQKNTSPDSK